MARAGDLYRMFLAVPVLRFALLVSQWGLTQYYLLFEVESYWVARLSGKPAGSAATPQSVLSILAQLAISRVDFLLRFVCGLLYGNYYTCIGTEETPLLYSLVGYMDIPDWRSLKANVSTLDFSGDALGKLSTFARAQPAPGWNLIEAPAKDNGSAPRQGPSDGQGRMKLMVDCAWLAYEEPSVIKDVLRRMGADSAVILTFVSVIYEAEDGGAQSELALDTQCLLFRKGNAVVLAFRGSQPVNFLDWAYDFTLNELPLSDDDRKKLVEASEPDKAPPKLTACIAAGHLTNGPESGTGSCANGTSPAQETAGAAPKWGRVHQGFARALGLELSVDNSKVIPLSTVFGVTPQLAQGGDEYVSIEGQQPAFDRLHSAPGSPYSMIKHAASGLLEACKSPAGASTGRLFVTGHSLGGALAALFATRFCLDSGEHASRVYAMTFGQPLVGDAAFARTMRGQLGVTQPFPATEEVLGPPAMPTPVSTDPDHPVLPEGRYVRVINDNDLVPRVPNYFIDEGEAFAHADGLGVVHCIDHAGVLQPALDARPTHAGFPAAALAAVRKLAVAWRRMRRGVGPCLPSEVVEQLHGGFQSSLRLLVRAVLTPIGVLNDHIDYKLLLRDYVQGGYWNVPAGAAIAEPSG